MNVDHRKPFRHTFRPFSLWNPAPMIEYAVPLPILIFSPTFGGSFTSLCMPRWVVLESLDIVSPAMQMSLHSESLDLAKWKKMVLLLGWFIQYLSLCVSFFTSQILICWEPYFLDITATSSATVIWGILIDLILTSVCRSSIWSRSGLLNRL